MQWYNKWIPLEEVRADCGVSRDGSNAKKVMAAARHYGLNGKGYRFETETLIEKGKFPCIIHWHFNHFVVLCGFRNGKAYLNDPAKGSYSLPLEEFDRSFTGICILLEPGENFVPSGRPKSMLSFASRRLKGTSAAMVFCILTTVSVGLISAINPGFSRIFLDRILTGKDPDWLVPFIVAFGAFTAIEVIMSGLSAVYSKRISGKMAAVGNSSFMWKIMKMPINFFSQRMAGDIEERKISNETIANTLIGTFAPLFINTCMMIVYFTVMVRYSLKLTLVGLCSIAINTAVSGYISKKRVNITRRAMRDTANLMSHTVAGIEMIETIKSSGAENGFFSKWAGYQANANNRNVELIRLNQFIGAIPTFMSSVANNAVLVLGVYLTMQGEFTVGMIMAFQGFLSSFMAPADTLISAGQTLQEMRTLMERVDDVMQYPDDNVFAEESDDDGASKLSGKIEIRGLVFGYSKLDPPLIKNIDLTVTPGKSVAIVGSSGCGKSTISKLISGLYSPWDGEILFDGKPLSEIDKGLFSASLAVVDQDITLFEDTIENNIKMWDESIEDFEMILAAKDAQLHSEIMERDGGYRSKITEGGKDLSGGQRQRIEIARVLAQDTTVIILDEATSALDAKTEYEVVKAIRDRGITTIVVAHRLSTIRSCDEIIVMDAGEIVDRGTHRELMEKCGLYRELVISE